MVFARFLPNGGVLLESNLAIMNKTIGFVFGAILLCAPVFANAQTISDSTRQLLIQTLMALVQKLEGEIAQIIAQQAALATQQTTLSNQQAQIIGNFTGTQSSGTTVNSSQSSSSSTTNTQTNQQINVQNTSMGKIIVTSVDPDSMTVQQAQSNLQDWSFSKRYSVYLIGNDGVNELPSSTVLTVTVSDPSQTQTINGTPNVVRKPYLDPSFKSYLDPEDDGSMQGGTLHVYNLGLTATNVGTYTVVFSAAGLSQTVTFTICY